MLFMIAENIGWFSHMRWRSNKLSDLIEYSKVLKVYKDELIGLYDKANLDEVLLFFYNRFEHYATKEVFNPNPAINKKVRKGYHTWALQCEEAIKLTDCKQKMVVIDHLINMAHKGGLFGMKLIKDFDVFKNKLKELEKRKDKKE